MRLTSTSTNNGAQYCMYFIVIRFVHIVLPRKPCRVTKINPKFLITCCKSKNGRGTLFIANNYFFTPMGSFSSIPFELSVAYFFPNRYFKEKEIISKGSWGISVDRQYDWHLWTKFCYVSVYIYGYKELANMSAWMVRQKLLIQINKRNPGFPSTFSEKKTLRDHPRKAGK